MENEKLNNIISPKDKILDYMQRSHSLSIINHLLKRQLGFQLSKNRKNTDAYMVRLNVSPLVQDENIKQAEKFVENYFKELGWKNVCCNFLHEEIANIHTKTIGDSGMYYATLRVVGNSSDMFIPSIDIISAHDAISKYNTCLEYAKCRSIYFDDYRNIHIVVDISLPFDIKFSSKKSIENAFTDNGWIFANLDYGDGSGETVLSLGGSCKLSEDCEKDVIWNGLILNKLK